MELAPVRLGNRLCMEIDTVADLKLATTRLRRERR
jgi:hypothetical protein